MQKSRRADHSGYTLIEVLIALAIISIALMAAIRASGQGAANVSELRSRLLAGWVAENRLAEYRARGIWLQPGSRRGGERQGGIEFFWREEVAATPNPAFRRVDIYVHATPTEPHVLAHVAGIIVQPVQTTK